MNADVLNEIFKRRPARDFLRLYPSEKWKEIIPDIFEIGVLNLKNSFGTLKFTKIDIKNILDDLRNYNPSEDIPVEEENTNEKVNYNIKKNNFKNNINNNFNNNIKNIHNIENEENDGDNEDNYENNEENDENNEENNEDDNDEDNNNDNEKDFNNNYNINDNQNYLKNSKTDDKKVTSNAEVFIPDMKKINNVNYNRPKIAYNSTFEEIKEKNIENKRNIGYAESKIKYQIMNDKMNHQAMKKRKLSNDENNENDGSFSFNQNKNSKNYSKNENKREKNTNKNYVINFDKHLNPQKPIEIQKRYELHKNNYNNVNLNNIGNNKVNNNDFNLNINSMENDEEENNYKNYNEDNIFNNFSSSNSNNNIDYNNNQINFGGKLNNFKLEKLSFPKYEYNRGLNNNI